MQSSAIKVGARTYAIACLSDEAFDFILAKKNVFDIDIKSFIDYDEQLIGVRSRMLPEHRRELVLHELFHAMAEDAGIKQDERSEELIRTLAPRLNALFDEKLVTILEEVCK